MFTILPVFLRKAAHFGRPFLKGFKLQSNSVGVQNVSLFKMFSSIQCTVFSRLNTGPRINAGSPRWSGR